MAKTMPYTDSRGGQFPESHWEVTCVVIDLVGNPNARVTLTGWANSKKDMQPIWTEDHMIENVDFPDFYKQCVAACIETAEAHVANVKGSVIAGAKDA